MRRFIFVTNLAAPSREQLLRPLGTVEASSCEQALLKGLEKWPDAKDPRVTPFETASWQLRWEADYQDNIAHAGGRDFDEMTPVSAIDDF